MQLGIATQPKPKQKVNDMNAVHVIGNIGADPDVKVFDTGKKVARFSVAVNSARKDKPVWVPCEIWEEACDRLLKCQQKAKLTGRKIQVSGSLALNEYKKQVGASEVQMRRLYIKVHSFELFGLKQETGEAAPAEPQGTAATEDYISA